MQNIIESHKEQISCTLSCYDRILIRGILPELSYATGMTKYLYDKHIEIFDYANFAESHKSVINKTVEELIKKVANSYKYYLTKLRKETEVSHDESPAEICHYILELALYISC
jgi:hypothetical protein